jgi:hypothetical protein
MNFTKSISKYKNSIVDLKKENKEINENYINYDECISFVWLIWINLKSSLYFHSDINELAH